MSVALTEPLAAAWGSRNSWFHDRHPEVVYDAPGACGLYFHGFRVYPGEGWRWAYDVTGMIERDKLSEDRQLRNVRLDSLFQKIIEQCPALPSDFYDLLIEVPSTKDSAPDVDLLRNAVYHLASSNRPSPGGFRMETLEERLMDKYGGHKVAYTTDKDPDSTQHYYARAAGYSVAAVDYYTENILSYSGNENLTRTSNVLPSVQNRMRPVSKSDVPLDTQGRLKEALRITRKLRPSRDGKPAKVRVTRMKLASDSMDANAWAVNDSNEVLIMEDYANRATVEDFISTLIHEFTHLSGGHRDGTTAFETDLVRTIATLITPKAKKANADEFETTF